MVKVELRWIELLSLIAAAKNLVVMHPGRKDHPLEEAIRKLEKARAEQISTNPPGVEEVTEMLEVLTEDVKEIRTGLDSALGDLQARTIESTSPEEEGWSIERTDNPGTTKH
jgi:hypothetical protein